MTNQPYTPHIVEPELRQYLMIVWRRWWLIALTTVLAAVAAFVVSRMQPPIYRATTTLEIDRGADPDDDPYRLLQGTEAIAQTYALQVAARPVVEAVIERLALPMTPQQVQDLLTVTQVRETSMIEVSAEHTDPGLVQALVATTAEVFIEQKAAQQRERYQSALAELEAQVARLETDIQATRGGIAALGDAADLSSQGRAELARLETQLTTDQTRLAVLLQSTEQFRLAMTRYGNHIIVFAPAERPAAPVGPQTLRNTALAAVVGGMIGVGTAFLLDYLDDTVRSPQEAERVLGINALAAIPELDAEMQNRVVVMEQPLHPAAEAFRNLRTNVRFANLDRRIRTLMVTSPSPAEGKSFVVANLAAAIAQSGKKVVVVEADLRRPTVHKLFDLPKAPGLSDALMAMSEVGDDAGQRDAVRALLHTPEALNSLLNILTAGQHVHNPAEILGSETFARLLAYLQDDADVVIVDTPPVMSVTDAAVVGTLVDGVLVIAEAGQTRLGAVQQSYDRLAAVGVPVMGLVINRLTPQTGGYYYYYYYQSYPYSENGDDRGTKLPVGRLLDRRRSKRRHRGMRSPQGVHGQVDHVN